MSDDMMTYAERIRVIERSIADIEGSDDVECALALHAKAEAHLRECEAIIERAKGQLTTESADGTAMDGDSAAGRSVP